MSLQKYHPLFMGTDYIGPAVDHFQKITAQYPEVRDIRISEKFT